MNRKIGMRKSWILGWMIMSLISIRISSAKEVAFEKDSSLPIVYIHSAFKVGSVSDPEGQSGLTHFMGEMLLRGTQTKTKEQIDLTLDQMGAKLEVETRAEALIFRGAVLSSQLDPFLKLLNEILTRPNFPEKEIKKLKSETVSLLREELGHDTSLGGRKFNQFLFQNHPYGKPIFGTIKDVESLSKKQILDHYNRLLREDTLLVLGTGDASESRISEWTDNLVKNLPHKALSKADLKFLKKVNPPENLEKRKLQLVDKPERTQTQIYLGQIGVQMTDPNFFPLYLGNYAFGGPSFSATLMEEIRVKRGWSYGANSSFRFGRENRAWTLHLFPAEKDTAQALEYTLTLVENLKEKGLKSEKFEFAKQSLINSVGFMFNTPRKRVENKLLERTLGLPDGYMQSYGPKLEAIQLQQVNTALKNFFKPDRLAISVLCTAKALKNPLAKAAKVEPETVEVTPYSQE